MSTPNTPEAPNTPETSAAPAAGAEHTSAQPTAAQPTATQPTVPLQPAVPPQQSAPAYAQQVPGGQPAYPAPGQPVYRAAAPAPAAAPRGTTLAQTNTYAVLAILLAFIAPIAGVVFGHMGLSQIKRTGDAGRGLAITGLVIGYAAVVFLALFFVLYIGFIAFAIAAVGSDYAGYSGYTY